ncbi:MAG: glutathione synthase [Gammaproteobacteria bacterium]|uniref:Glutathione synthetase n=1 Tax=Candidatus Thiopontia autotrophica TaxID=2841688 RepID=A0A8J6P853_9GAMM|nr:glutathione synthase [Candidatus Thiopontia autotrophica]MBL6969289.1 glutathione synthase [Gammaproteobacteria bacterium]
MRIGIVMDPIQTIHPYKDSSLAMLLEAQKREWEIHYMEMDDLFLEQGTAMGQTHLLQVMDDMKQWYVLGEKQAMPLSNLDVILMRKDPPFDREYLYATHILELAERDGAMVVNRPQALRDLNEKLATSWFPELSPPSLVTSNEARIRQFLDAHEEIILKPLDAMGGTSIFRLRSGDQNTGVIIETITNNGSSYVMAQRFIPEITAGDKRILMVDGDPIPYALARIPAEGENRGNLAAGGRGEGIPLSERDLEIAQKVSPLLQERGLLFVGLDVIGDWLTEINVTSPTCIRELDNKYDLNIAGDLMDAIERRLGQ